MEAQLDFILRGAKTKRFHTADTLTTQNVGEHSFGVAWIVHLVDPYARKGLILAALAHDLAEHVVGDVSSVVKREIPELRELLHEAESEKLNAAALDFEAVLTTDERRILKFADLLDGMLFCVREKQMGSSRADAVYCNFLQYIRHVLVGLPPNAHKLFCLTLKKWSEVHE